MEIKNSDFHCITFTHGKQKPKNLFLKDLLTITTDPLLVFLHIVHIYYSEVLSIKPAMVLVESGLNSEQVL